MAQIASPVKQLSRVALVTGSLGLGGSTTFLCTFGRELLARGVQSRIYSFEAANPLGEDFEAAGLRVFAQEERKAIFEARLSAILHQLAEFQPDVVLANLSPESYEVLRYLPTGVFRVIIAHSDDPEVYDTIRYYFGHVDLIGAVSEKVRAQLAASPGADKTSIKHLPLGVPMPDRPPARDFSTSLRILYLGRLDKEQKRVHLFPEILAELERSMIPFHWTIAGDGHDSQWLHENMQSAVAAGKVTFKGKVPYRAVGELLATHDIFLLASDYEGLPLGLLEAMGSGLVPVVSDLPSGIREVVDESTGWRVALNDVAAYAKAIVQLHRDRPKLEHLSANARQRVVDNFSAAAMATRWLAAFPRTVPSLTWPEAWKILPPLPAATSWRFTTMGKYLRKLAIRLRS